MGMNDGGLLDEHRSLRKGERTTREIQVEGDAE
jgi:hypothetical protein